MKLELLGFKICPFVQRVTILIQSKGVDCAIAYLNPKELPPWLETISPLGKVPLLRVGREGGDVADDGAVVFESQVINEFLDETHAPALLPSEPLERARQRAFVAVADGLLGGLWNWVTAKDAAAADAARAAMCRSLGVLETALPDGAREGAFFSGAGFGLADCALAPFFMRLDLLESRGVTPLSCGELPRVAAYRRALAATPAVEGSVVAEFPQLYLGFVKSQGGLVGEILD